MNVYNFGHLRSCIAWAQQATVSSGHVLKARPGIWAEDGDGILDDPGSSAGRTRNVTAYEL